MLAEKINSDLKEALKSGQVLRVSVLRMLLSDIKNKEIESRGAAQLVDEDIVSVVRKMIKTHQESIVAFEKGGRIDLVSQEKEELKVLSAYVPAMLDEVVVKTIIQETLGARRADFGSSMKEVMARLKGQAEGTLVSRLVKDYLAQ